MFSSTNLFSYFVRGIVLLTALPLHECAHAWASNKLGDPTAKNLGRLSLNPFVHLDLWGSILMILTGFGWAKPVPIFTRNFKNVKKGMILSSLAGPFSNILLALVCMLLYKIWILMATLISIGSDGTITAIAMILYIMCILNINLAVFNLIPIPPLDGSRLLTAILPSKWYYKLMDYEQYVMIGLCILIFIGILDGPLNFLRSVVYNLLDIITGFLGRM